MTVLNKQTLVSLTLLLFAAASAQVKERTSSSDKNLETQQTQGGTTKEDLSAMVSGVPMEGAVNPELYVVGPSDVFQVGLWGPISASYPLVVTPEGTIIVPTVGEMKVAGLKLSDAKNLVLEKVRSKYTLGDVTFTLIKPRSFVVTLRGAVLHQGQYVMTPVDRVDKLIALGAMVQAPRPTITLPSTATSTNAALTNEYINMPKVLQTEEIYDRASTRNVLIIRKDGDTLRVDIPKFYATGVDRYNPYLQDGDVVYVPQRNLSWGFISVEGAVNAPGRYEFVEGDSLLDALNIAQGFTRGADKSHIMISRLSDSGALAEEITVDADMIHRGIDQDIPLKRGDRIVVHEMTSGIGNYSVMVNGEVRQPGIYPVARRGTMLTKLLKDAGGFTADALTSGLLILRKDDKMDEFVDPQIEYLRATRSNQLTAADSSYYYLATKLGRHSVMLDPQKLFVEHDSTADVPLQNGDLIYVPSNQHTVLVHGQVANPGYTPYVKGADLDYYIQKAGGYSELAVSGDTRVIKKASLDWVEPGKTTIEPGDQIWVPKKVVHDFKYYWEIFRDVVSLTASVVTSVYLVRTFSK